MFTITSGPAKANLSVVAGQNSYFGIFLYILIDYGATHCFVTYSLFERLGIQLARVNATFISKPPYIITLIEL